MISGSDTVIDRIFMFPSIAGTDFTFRYQTVRQVAGGCGAAGYSNIGSTIALKP